VYQALKSFDRIAKTADEAGGRSGYRGSYSACDGRHSWYMCACVMFCSVVLLVERLTEHDNKMYGKEDEIDHVCLPCP